MNLPYLRFLLYLPLSVFILPLLANRPDSTTPSCTVSFYSAESNINNYSLVKGEFDRYLSTYGNLSFQPFDDRLKLEHFLSDSGEGVAIVSSWHFRNLCARLPLQPLLIGYWNDTSLQRRVLCTAPAIQRIEMLEGRKVASAGSVDYTKAAIIEILGDEKTKLIDSMEFLVVPKEIDAFMALSFGIVQAAVISEHNLRDLAGISPQEFKTVNQLASSQSSLLPIVAVKGSVNDNVLRCVTVLEGMDDSPHGRKPLMMINLHGFKKISENERKLLR